MLSDVFVRETCLCAKREERRAKCGVRNSLSLIIKTARRVKGIA